MKHELSFLPSALLVGGVPTFVGTILGWLYCSPVAYTLFLSSRGELSSV